MELDFNVIPDERKIPDGVEYEEEEEEEEYYDE